MNKSIPSLEKQRIEYIDLAKAIGIIFVIVGHIVSSDTVAKNVIYSFHMPLFFILSGFLLTIREYYSKETWKMLIIKKARGLLLPYIIWGLIYSAFSFKHSVFILYGTRETLINAESLTSLWFLPVMFLAFLLSELILQIAGKSEKPNLVIATGIIGTAVIGFLIPHYPKYGDPWGIDIAFIATSFMLIGFFLRKGIKKLTNKTAQLTVLITSLLLFIVLVRYSDSSVGYVLMANAVYGNAFVFFGCALSGSIAVIMASNMMTRFRLKGFQTIGQKTLGIFVVHKPLVELGRSLVTKMGYSFDETVFVLIITVVALIVSYITVTIIQMIIPEIIGLKHKTERGIT